MLQFNILHYQFLWIFHDKIQSNMHNFTLFSREIEWNLKCFHFFREMKSETNIPFTLFEKWKVKWFFVSLFSRSESEIEIPRDRDREVKFQKKSREFSRNETLAGYWEGNHTMPRLQSLPHQTMSHNTLSIQTIVPIIPYCVYHLWYLPFRS